MQIEHSPATRLLADGTLEPTDGGPKAGDVVGVEGFIEPYLLCKEQYEDTRDRNHPVCTRHFLVCLEDGRRIGGERYLMARDAVLKIRG